MDLKGSDIDIDSSIFFEEGGRGCRNKKKHSDPACCPVCSITLRSSEVDTHLMSEIERLNKIASTKLKPNGKSLPSTSLMNGNAGNSNSSTSKHWETYQKVRANRQTRQRLKSRKRKNEETVCPICNKEVEDDITEHVATCLRKSGNEVDSENEEPIDVEAFEEYEWAGQSRVRVTSMLQGGLSTLGSTISMTEEDEDLNVDGDDSHVYGSPQYNESDVILPNSDNNNEALRNAVIGDEPKQADNQDPSASNVPTVEQSSAGDPVVEVLKARIRELESREQIRDGVFKCLICMDKYHKPVISICCWHVHCEQCWLQTLGAKKLCPQCNMITSPSDLRRIYM